MSLDYIFQPQISIKKRMTEIMTNFPDSNKITILKYVYFYAIKQNLTHALL